MGKQKQATPYPGVRYREHPQEKAWWGPRQIFFIRYKFNGKDKEAGLGWASAGMTAAKASRILGEIRENIRKGEGPLSLADMRDLRAKIEREAAEQLDEENRRSMDFSTFFNTCYLPAAQLTKQKYSVQKEHALYNNWLAEIIGMLPITDISIKHVENIAHNMVNAGKSKRTIQYALAVISQVWNYAKKLDIIAEDSPTKKYKIGKLDNKRTRFLTEADAELLLNELEKHNIDLQQICILSLFCGLRAVVIFKLRWVDVNLHNNTLLLHSTKAGNSRYAFLTPEVKKILSQYDIVLLIKIPLFFQAEMALKREQYQNYFQKL